MEYISNELKINNINFNDIVDLLVLSNGSDIDVFYNDDMMFFPSTVFDGYDSSYKEKIINKSIRLPKIKEIYNFYHKTYGNNSLGNLSRNKDKIFLKPINAKSSNNNENHNFDGNEISRIENNIDSLKYMTINNSSKKHNTITNNKNIKNNISSNSLFNIYKRNYLLSKTQKYNHRYSRNKIKSFSQKRYNYFIQSHKINVEDKKKSQSGNIGQFNTFYTDNDNKMNNYNKYRKNDSILHRRVSSLIKELNVNKNTLLLLFKDEENKENTSKKSSKEISKSKLREARNKLISLFNKKENDFLNFSSKRKILKSENPIIKKPTNNLEMNELIINSFGTGFNHSEYAKKLYNLNETFFSLLENMKQRRAEMDIAKFERQKNKYQKKEDQKINYEVFFQKGYRDKWERKFMLNQYKYKIPEKEFKKFKKYKQAQMKKKIVKDSQKLTLVLRPNDLGRLSIELTSNKDGLCANIIAQNEHVRSYIERNVNDLRNQLSQAGVNVNSIQIKTAGENNTSTYDGSQNREFQQQEQNQNQQNNQQKQQDKNQEKNQFANMGNYDLHFAKDFSSVLNKTLSYMN